MITSILTDILTKELKKLREEIGAFSTEEKLWIIDGDIKNCAGNLCLHMVGNLNAYIGAELGKTGYVRDRDGEFNDKNVPRSKLLNKIDETVEMIENTLSKLDSKTLESDFPLKFKDKPINTQFFLVNLTSHLSYHLGQVNYLRRLLDN